MKLKFTIVLCFLFASIGNLFAQNLEVSGIVKDDKGEPLLGVFVLIKGTQRGASTDLDGRCIVVFFPRNEISRKESNR